MKNQKLFIFLTPVMSFFSPRFYRSVAHYWKGSNMAYLFVLLAVCCYPAAMKLQELVLDSVDGLEAEFLHQMPEIEIKNGSAVVDVPQPYYIKDNNGQAIAVINTTGSMNYIDDASVMALLTEDELIVRRGEKRFDTIELSEFGNLKINQGVIAGWIQTLKKPFAPATYALILFSCFLLSATAILALASAICFVLAFTNFNLKFMAITRTAVAAITPPVIGITVASTLHYPIMPEIFLGATAAYLLTGISACGAEPIKIERDEKQINLKAVLKEDKDALSRAA